ncbi:hypothetical protein IE53DRAFT_99064 [Violaceomyces palustris]|uniref:Uncharacterized protein n=2 Tax=Violaceomyces palustris TaxID=1673888 RepID=A0ACD0NX78_9BASI|nr:hypothetical protein IE53DRAFT_179571 [Violaceomyces palustris]PWN50367.1 hypothetical protein IE53DRAFT_99064 [Violaceomyces palustris]
MRVDQHTHTHSLLSLWSRRRSLSRSFHPFSLNLFYSIFLFFYFFCHSPLSPLLTLVPQYPTTARRGERDIHIHTHARAERAHAPQFWLSLPPLFDFVRNSDCPSTSQTARRPHSINQSSFLTLAPRPINVYSHLSNGHQRGSQRGERGGAGWRLELPSFGSNLTTLTFAVQPCRGATEEKKKIMYQRTVV